jgi:hypothetical protein
MVPFASPQIMAGDDLSASRPSAGVTCRHFNIGRSQMSDQEQQGDFAAGERAEPQGPERDFAEGEEAERPGRPRDFAEGEERDDPGAPRDFAEGQEHEPADED